MEAETPINEIQREVVNEIQKNNENEDQTKPLIKEEEPSIDKANNTLIKKEEQILTINGLQEQQNFKDGEEQKQQEKSNDDQQNDQKQINNTNNAQFGGNKAKDQNDLINKIRARLENGSQTKDEQREQKNQNEIYHTNNNFYGNNFQQNNVPLNQHQIPIGFQQNIPQGNNNNIPPITQHQQIPLQSNYGNNYYNVPSQYPNNYNNYAIGNPNFQDNNFHSGYYQNSFPNQNNMLYPNNQAQQPNGYYNQNNMPYPNNYAQQPNGFQNQNNIQQYNNHNQNPSYQPIPIPSNNILEVPISNTLNTQHNENTLNTRIHRNMIEPNTANEGLPLNINRGIDIFETLLFFLFKIGDTKRLDLNISVGLISRVAFFSVAIELRDLSHSKVGELVVLILCSVVFHLFILTEWTYYQSKFSSTKTRELRFKITDFIQLLIIVIYLQLIVETLVEILLLILVYLNLVLSLLQIIYITKYKKYTPDNYYSNGGMFWLLFGIFGGCGILFYLYNQITDQYHDQIKSNSTLNFLALVTAVGAGIGFVGSGYLACNYNYMYGWRTGVANGILCFLYGVNLGLFSLFYGFIIGIIAFGLILMYLFYYCCRDREWFQKCFDCLLKEKSRNN